MRSKHLHDVDAGGGDKPVEKQLKRKGKELCIDDDFVEDSSKIPSVKKPKVSPFSSKSKKKKPSKKVPKLVHKKILVKGEKLNFSLREFGLINGLNSVNNFSDYSYTSTYVSHLMTTYFPNKQRVEKWHLKNVVTNKVWANDEDAVRLCILYLLEFFVCPSDKDHVSFIDKFMFFLIESGNFESYPWGIKSFKQVIESVRHRLNPHVHSYLIRGCSLALQVWLYECCSSVSTELATRCSESIPRILRWSATKGQIWLTAIEEKMIKPEWLKFTSMTESGEEIGVLNLPDKIQYEDEHGAQSSQVPIDASPTFEPKHTDCQEDTESVTSKLRKLEKGIEQVDGKLVEFSKAVFEELSSLREFIDVSVKSVMKVINSKYDVDESRFAGSSTKNNDQQQRENNQQFQFNIGDQVHASTSNTAAISPDHVQAHVEEEPEFEEVAEAQQAKAGVSPGAVPAMVEEEPGFQEGAEVEKADIEDNVPQSPIHGATVNELVPEGSGIDKKGLTLDDFELLDNLTQLVMYVEPIPDEATPIHPGRTRQPGKHARSPFTPLYSSGGSTYVGPKFFYLKHPFTTVIGENVDADLIERFTNWLYLRSDKVSKRRKEYFSKKDNQIKPWLDLGCEKVDKKDWFYALAHPGQVINNTHIDVIMYYLRKRGKYGPNNDIRFTTTDCLFRTKIERIYDKFISSPPELKYSVVKSDDDVAEYILGYRLLANVAWDVVDYVIMPVNIVENFHWLLLVFDIADRQLYVYDSMVSSNRHNTVESLVDKFSIIIPLYLSCTGFYGKCKDIDFKTTKAYIEKPVTDPLNIQWMVAEIPQQKEGSLDCGVFVAAFAEYVSLGDLAIPKEDLSDIDQHRRRYGALLWDYAAKKQEDGSISESEVTGRLLRRKGAPAKNERTRVQRKKK
ncbi:PREDICTED: uncharacterized protein LOC109218928 [Nicotiana attenuata]|uniref:uncharacterized protein LOC109218928 n=1 Tax=Nicotiana attenuata TaxID=49451 RepID=UPI000905A365|nr:PREDICTED: uncharacterized protein LOC109218928 [Nicotiana attenuata]